MDTVIVVGEAAPLFQLEGIDGDIYALEKQQGWIVLLNFWSAECEWCERIDKELTTWMKTLDGRVKIWWIVSNVNEMREIAEKAARERNLPTVLLDDHHYVADLYGAQTTPHFFVVDTEGILWYQGAWDDVTFRHRVASKVYVPKVIEHLLNGQEPEITQTPAYGCVLVRHP